MKKQPTPRALRFRSVAAVAAAACIALAAGATFMAQRVDAQPAAAPAPAAAPGAQAAVPDAQVERGRYLARVADCVSCHSAPGGAPFAGGLPMDTPFGKVISTNITPDPQAGLGNYTEADFMRAVREGVAKDGHRLYPAMPYASFARTSDEDMRDLYAYFRRGVQPVAEQPPPTQLPWPFSMRFLLVGWNWLYLDRGTYQPVAERSAEWNRGAYLVNGLGHCGECHTPRSRLGGLKAASEKDGDAYLSGALIDGWHAQALRHGAGQSAAKWSTDDLVRYLQTGRTAHSGSFGPMAQVVENSTQFMTPQDLTAVATYLQSVGAPAGYTPPPTAAPQGNAAVAAARQAPHPDTTKLRNGTVEGQRGAMLYLNNCNACHRSSGAGWAQTFPALAGNSVVNASDPTSLIRIVLQGGAMPATALAPTPLGMPPFGWRLPDEDVAQLLSFVRASWGNQAAAVTPAQVAAVRKAITPTTTAEK